MCFSFVERFVATPRLRGGLGRVGVRSFGRAACVLRDREQLTGHLRVLAAFTLLLLINICSSESRRERRGASV